MTATKPQAPDGQTLETPETILEEAARLVEGDRRETNGPVFDSFDRIVTVFNTVTGRTLTPREAVIFMLCLKLCREGHHPARDNRVDLCGYARCLDIVNDVFDALRKEALDEDNPD